MVMKYIILVGCGRLGSLLANRFSLKGHSLVVIDLLPEAFEQLSSDFSGFTIEGDATELAVLTKAKIDRADAVFTVTSNDNINLMVAQIAKDIYKVPTVMARVFDPKREVVYNNLNIRTLCPTLLAADEFVIHAEL
jgi:trk system potassium uptake protein